MPRAKRRKLDTAPVAAPDESLLSKHRALVARIESDLRGKGLSASEVAKLSAAARGIYDKIGLLTGEGQVTEAQILKSPAFERLMRKMQAALTPLPEAARALAEALCPVEGKKP
jgi:hypothetical protein